VVVFATGSFGAGLQSLAEAAERAGESYPWRDEDWLRYLLPDLFVGDGERRALIIGPSEAREDLLYERLDSAFPGVRHIQGAQSMGTLEDALLLLEYLEHAHGADALPDRIILGTTPRFVSSIRRGTRSPLAMAINRYSPEYRVVRSREGPRLVRKDQWDGIAARIRFAGKQPDRYRAAVCATLLRAFPQHDAADGAAPAGGGPIARLARGLDRCRSPYRWHGAPPLERDELEGWLKDPTSFWSATRRWNPDVDAKRIVPELRRLRAFAERHGITLHLVNLPEHPLFRNSFPPARYQGYLRLLQQGLGNVPCLNLHTALSASEFFDLGHATLPGAIRVTDLTIEFIRQHEARTRNLGAVGTR